MSRGLSGECHSSGGTPRLLPLNICFILMFKQAFNNTYEVAKIMDTWTRQMGYPVVSFEDKGDTFVLHQEVFLLDQSMHKVKDKEDNPFG